MNTAESETCPLCCEPVRPAAKKCPHCQHFLNKWVLAAYHPLIALCPMLLMFCVGIYWLSNILKPGLNFEDYRAQVRAVQSELQFGELPTGPTVAVVGTIQNDSSIAWKAVVLEVRFFDKAHRVIDTKQSERWSDDFELPVRGTGAFKVSQLREFERDNYASYEIHIIDARDRRGLFE